MDKQFTPAEVKFLQDFAEEVLYLAKDDDTGMTDDIAVYAETALEILGKPKITKHENEPEDFDGEV